LVFVGELVFVGDGELVLVGDGDSVLVDNGVPLRQQYVHPDDMFTPGERQERGITKTFQQAESNMGDSLRGQKSGQSKIVSGIEWE
jgi:hypothetical protein